MAAMPALQIAKIAGKLIASSAIAVAFVVDRSHADTNAASVAGAGGFRFPYLSSSPSPSDNTDTSSSSSSFSAEALERAAKALREINSSPYAKQVFDLMRSQEDSRQAEMAAEKAHHLAMQSMNDIETQRKLADQQMEVIRDQAQAKAQMARHDDELARKRMQADHEAQRQHNVALVKMQEESNIRQEKARSAREAEIQAKERERAKERADIERETIKAKAMADAEGRALYTKKTEEQERRLLMDKMNGEKEKWVAAINATFAHIEGGMKKLLTDRTTLVMTVGGVTAVAAGVYTTREGARVTWGYINRILGQPSLIRESSIGKFPWSNIFSRAKSKFSGSGSSSAKGLAENSSFDKIILHPSLKRRIEHLARATENTRYHQAPFRNMLFYGPPGTGKTLVAREMAHKSGLDYAMMTGGDVAPLGSEAVTKIHQIFDWAKKSRKGLLLFIDEADAFLCERNSIHMSEAQRSALNALLFRTGDQSSDIVLVLATNRPGDLDAAITDRMDEVIEFPLPGEEERFKLLNLYLNQYIVHRSSDEPRWRLVLKTQQQQKIVIKEITDEVLREAAKKINGFSGREIAKLLASVRAAVYGQPDCVLDSHLLMQIIDYKVTEHHQCIKLASGTSN